VSDSTRTNLYWCSVRQTCQQNEVMISVNVAITLTTYVKHERKFPWCEFKSWTQSISQILYLAPNKEQRSILGLHAYSRQYQLDASFKSCLRFRNDEYVVVSSMSAFVVQLFQRLSISFVLCTDAVNTSRWITCADGRRKPFCCWKGLFQYWTSRGSLLLQYCGTKLVFDGEKWP